MTSGRRKKSQPKGRGERPPSSSSASTLIIPFTERVLAVLPGPRWIWIIMWSLISIPLSFLTLRLVEEFGGPQVRSEPPSPWVLAAYVNATFLAVWGAGKLASEAQRTE